MSRDVSAVSDRVVWWTGHFKVAYTVGCVYTVGPTVCRVIHSTHGSEAFYHSHINLAWRLWGANSYVMYVTVCVCLCAQGKTNYCPFFLSLCLFRKKRRSKCNPEPRLLSVYFWVCASRGAGGAEVSWHLFFFFFFWHLLCRLLRVCVWADITLDVSVRVNVYA